MTTLKNTQKISLVFFIIFGLGHIISGLMATNQYFYSVTSVLNKTLDIPFALTGLLYGITSLKLTFTNPEKSNKTLSTTIMIVLIVALLALVYINFFVPDLNGR